MSQETLQVQEDGKLVDQHLRQEASELQHRGTAASEVMEEEEDENRIIGGSVTGKTTLGNVVPGN